MWLVKHLLTLWPSCFTMQYNTLHLNLSSSAHLRSRLGILQRGCVCVPQLLWCPSQPVQPCQIHKVGLLGRWTGGGMGSFTVSPTCFVTAYLLIYFFLGGLGSSWNPTATQEAELCMRKLFQCTTTAPSKMTVRKYLSRMLTPFRKLSLTPLNVSIMEFFIMCGSVCDEWKTADMTQPQNRSATTDCRSEIWMMYYCWIKA